VEIPTSHDQTRPYARRRRLLVAIDIAKTRNGVLIEAPDGRRRRRLTILNTRDDHDRLIEVLSGYGGCVVVGLEATGDYHRALAWRLAQTGFGLRLISSVALARTREALHHGWDKNDPKDAGSCCTCCGSAPSSAITTRW
jgi:hypothetical protein